MQADRALVFSEVAMDTQPESKKRRVTGRGRLPVPGQLLVGVDAFARMIGISAVGAYRMLHRGEIPVVRVGGRTLIAVAEIEKFIEARSGAFLDGPPPAVKARRSALADGRDA